MFSPSNSRHFVRYVDEQSGIVSYILATHVAPVQKEIYFCNSGYSNDGRYLWFVCCYPPSLGSCMAVIDFLTDEIHVYREVGDGGCYVNPHTGDIWWCARDGIYRRSPHLEDKPVRIARAPEEIRRDFVTSMGTHLTFTSDFSEIFTDIQTKNGSYVCSFSLKTHEWSIWYKTEPGTMYNHAQICPANPDLGMCAHEGTFNARNEFVPPPMIDGIYPRLQIIGRDGTRSMQVSPENFAMHEWWARDGHCIYYCGRNRIYRDKLDGSPAEVVVHAPIENGQGTWHGFSSQDDRYFVFDGSYPDRDLSCWRGCPSTARFYNTETKKIVNIITRNPDLECWNPDDSCPYHIDPHPRFVQNDIWVTHTTTVRGKVSLAVTPVDQLIKASL